MSAYDDLIIADGAVSYYKLDESSGTTATDSGTGSNNGTYVNTPILDQNGLIFENTHRSVDFEATTSERISFTANQLLDGVNTSSAITLEGWYNVEAFGAGDIVSHELIIDGTNRGASLRFTSGGAISVIARSVTGDADQTLTFAWNVTATTTYIVAVIDYGSDSIYIFQDGIQVAKGTATFTNTTLTKGTPTRNDSLMGTAVPDLFFDGRSSNLAIYNKALTPLQIRKHYSEGIAKGFDKEVLDLAPVFYLPLDEASGESKDRVNQNNGVHTSTTQNVAGGLVSLLNKDDKTVTFNGTTSLVTVTDQTAIQNIFDGGGTLFFWINANNDGEADTGRIADKRQAAAVGWFLLVRDEVSSVMKLRFFQTFDGAANGDWKTTSTEISINTETFIAITYNSDSVGNNPIFYINGVQLTVGSGITEDSTPIGTRVSDVGTDLTIGNIATAAATFDGEISKSGVVGSILTAAQIRTLYQSGIVDLINRGYDKVIDNITSVVGFWRLGEGRNGVVFDESGTDNDGVADVTTVVGSTGPLAQDLSTAYTFDGAASSVTITDQAVIQNVFDGTGGSIAAWINTTSDGEGNIGKIVDKSVGWFLEVREEVASKVKIRFLLDCATTDGHWTTTATEVDIGVWSLVVVTFDSDGTPPTVDPTIYVNGVSVTSSETQTPVGARVSDIGADLIIGNNSGATATFDGDISHVVLFNAILTAQEILQIYESGVSRFAAEAISKQPALYARLNETSGSAINYGSDTTSGTVTGVTQGDQDTPLDNEVPKTTSYNFDGLSGDVDFTSPAAFDDIFVGGGSVLAIVKPASSGETSGRILDKRAGSATGWFFSIVGSASNEELRFAHQFSTGGDWSTLAGTIDTSTFQLVVATFNSSNLTAPDLYIDSLQSVPNSGDTAATGTQVSGNTENLLIGNRPADDRTFDGEMAEVMLFGSILTITDILDMQEFISISLATNPLPERIRILTPLNNIYVAQMAGI